MNEELIVVFAVLGIFLIFAIIKVAEEGRDAEIFMKQIERRAAIEAAREEEE